MVQRPGGDVDVWETPGAQELTEGEARRMLDRGRFGRVATILGAVPVIWPVPYATVGGEIVFRIAPGPLRRSVDGSVVAFQADGPPDPAALPPGPGSSAPLPTWHVLAVGPARVVTSERDLRRLDLAAVPTWPGLDVGHYVRVHPTLVRAQRLPASPTVPAPLAEAVDRWEAGGARRGGDDLGDGR